jgi:arylsulfatase A-like enzyme
MIGVRVLMIGVLTTAPLGATAAQTPSNAAKSRPNVILILTDDIGYGDLGSYGAPDARTPHIDRLAREGVRFTDAYANGATCSPTRAALITGRYQQRVGIEWPLGNSRGDTARGVSGIGATLPALLKSSGYATGLIGKWHLGTRPEFSPNANGFDEFFGILGAAVDYYNHTDPAGRSDLYENTTPIEVPGYLTDVITKRAVSFVDRHTSSPFFLEVAYNATHFPFQPPDHAPTEAERRAKSFFDQPSDSVPATRHDYVRMLERVDDGVGDIMRALERHGLAQNTLVIFTNDNGGEWLSRNAPFFHRKGTLWEGGIRVPLIMWWPNRVPGGRTSKQVAITMDLTASILSAIGTARPELHLDGIDLLPILRSEAPVQSRELFWRAGRQGAVRSGKWKLLIDQPEWYGPHLLLFDLSKDPGERSDVAQANPAIVAKLRASLAAWAKDVGPPPLDR